MKKLELKHIAPYLPYGLKIQTVIGVLELNKIYMHYIYPYWCTTSGDVIKKDFNFGILNKENCVGKGFKENEIKPILRPRSDLTKEIEHNGERFMPIEKMLDSTFFENDINIDIRLIRYGDVEKLFEWHFDLFGLIEKGLAIAEKG